MLVVAASGIGGHGDADAIVTRRVRGNFIVIGDMETECSMEHPPLAPRVALAAAKQADAVLSHFPQHLQRPRRRMMGAREITRQSILDTDIYCLTAERFSRGRSNVEVVRVMLDHGIRLVQYREKDKKMGLKYEECLEIRRMTREAGAAFVVNDDIDLAMLVGADGRAHRPGGPAG